MRRYILFSFALFACVQIIFGFVLITGADYGFKVPLRSVNVEQSPSFAFKTMQDREFLFQNFRDEKLASVARAHQDQEK